MGSISCPLIAPCLMPAARNLNSAGLRSHLGRLSKSARCVSYWAYGHLASSCLHRGPKKRWVIKNLAVILSPANHLTDPVSISENGIIATTTSPSSQAPLQLPSTSPLSLSLSLITVSPMANLPVALFTPEFFVPPGFEIEEPLVRVAHSEFTVQAPAARVHEDFVAVQVEP